jgi:uncharacterized membrane protein
MTGSSGALRLGAAAVLGQIALQMLWHAWLIPGTRAALALAVLPLLPPLWIGLRNLRRGVLVAGIVSLFYFCAGVANLWSDPASRGLSALEILLSLLIIGCSYGDARANKRPAS